MEVVSQEGRRTKAGICPAETSSCQHAVYQRLTQMSRAAASSVDALGKRHREEQSAGLVAHLDPPVVPVHPDGLGTLHGLRDERAGLVMGLAQVPAIETRLVGHAARRIENVEEEAGHGGVPARERTGEGSSADALSRRTLPQPAAAAKKSPGSTG